MIKGLKCGLLGLLFAASSIGLSIVYSGNASAASIYDGVYHTTDELILQNSSDNVHYPITPEDIGAIFAGSAPAPFTQVRFAENSSSNCPTLNTPCGDSLDFLNDLLALDLDVDSMSITQYWPYGGAPGGWPIISVCIATGSQMVLDWSTSRVSVTGQDRCMYLDSNSILGRIYVRAPGGSNVSLGALRVLSTSTLTSPPAMNLFCENCDPNYPVDYDGQLIRDELTPPVPPEVLYPDYSWSLSLDENETGILSVEYLGNLPHFLTGVSHLVVERMTEDWDDLDESLGSLSQNPAGWAKWQFNIGDEAGWYMFRIDHSQQLDEPPWPADNNYSIGQVFYQFYWDGQSAIAGSTVGCDGTVCNQFEQVDGSLQRYLNALKLEAHGLTAIIMAPLAFISTLPSAGESCSPITLPMPFGDPVSLPCLKPYYEEHLPTPLFIYQAAVTGIFVYTIAVAIFSRIRQITDPNDNSIEAVKL